MDFEITSTTFSGKSYIYEEAPKIANSIACVYMDDGYGASSPGTGFFFNITQGTLNQGTFTVNQPTSNQTIDIADQNINNTDVWLYSLDQSTGLESTLWTQVPALTGNNVIYNSLAGNIKNIYSVITRASDAITLSFSDGTFGALPIGSFRSYYRVSNNLSYTVNPYQSAQGQAETLTVTLSLASSIANATPTETNTSIKTNAPQTYYTQNRMITGEDYNISPLSVNQQVAKVKAVNRTSSGISRYFDLVDPTGKYSSTNLFANDGALYQQSSTNSTTFTYVTKTDVQGVIYNTVFDILDADNLRNFYYANYVVKLTTSGAGTNNTWNPVTTDSNTTSGYFYVSDQNVPVTVGPNVVPAVTSDLRYLTAGALIKFSAPTGYFYDTKNNNALVTDGTAPGTSSYIWASVVSIAGDGTAGGTGTLSTGFGPIVLNKVVPALSYVSQIIPQYTGSINTTTISTMIDLIFANTPFGLRYDTTTQAWTIIYEANLNTSGDFSLGNQGDTTNTRLDSSWLVLFATNGDFYSVTSRSLRYVFESDMDVTFYFDSNTKIYDSVTSKIISDSIVVLSVNTQQGVTTPFTTDMQWKIVSEYIGQDGYVDPKKIVVSFADTNSIIDNPDLFLDVITNPNTGDISYVVEQLYTISEGQQDYKYVSNNPETGPVIIVSTDSEAQNISNIGKYFYITSTGVVKLMDEYGNLNPTLDYRVFVGRDGLKFQYTHSADYDSRIDPGSSNIMDIYVLTNAYDIAFRQWLNGAIVNEPLPPSSSELNNLLSPSLNLIKATSDEVIYHPVSYKLLFGQTADPTLQATFNVMMNPNSTASVADVTARILTAINQFFALSNWDFGDTFYFTELSTYVMNQLAPDITNFVIVPKNSGQFFGSLFEIQCPSNQIFLSSAAATDINIVSGFTSSNLKTVTGTALASVVSSQQITSANYGATN